MPHRHLVTVCTLAALLGFSPRNASGQSAADTRSPEYGYRYRNTRTQPEWKISSGFSSAEAARRERDSFARDSRRLCRSLGPNDSDCFKEYGDVVCVTRCLGGQLGPNAMPDRQYLDQAQRHLQDYLSLVRTYREIQRYARLLSGSGSARSKAGRVLGEYAGLVQGADSRAERVEQLVQQAQTAPSGFVKDQLEAAVKSMQWETGKVRGIEIDAQLSVYDALIEQQTYVAAKKNPCQSFSGVDLDDCRALVLRAEKARRCRLSLSPEC